uniref:Uncharacterized protein n=1 Tax=Anguilla anguilla TaxID=7936 RepID=A0A0E9R500_ANGAN
MEKYQPADYRILTGRPSLHIPVPVEIYPQETFYMSLCFKMHLERSLNTVNRSDNS